MFMSMSLNSVPAGVVLSPSSRSLASNAETSLSLFTRSQRPDLLQLAEDAEPVQVTWHLGTVCLT